MFQADAIDQIGRSEIVKISGAIEESGQKVCQKLVAAAQRADVAIAQEETCVCHRLVARKLGPERVTVKFVRRHTKRILLANSNFFDRNLG